MPIHDLGYRNWEGNQAPEGLRFWVIGRNGIRLAWKSRWLRRSMFYAWVPFLAVGGLIYGYEHLIARTGGQAADPDTPLLDILPGRPEGPRRNESPDPRRVPRSGAVAGGSQQGIGLNLEAMVRRALHEESKDEKRHTVWSVLFFMFFRYPQGALMVLLVGQIAPALISRDVRSQAFLLYFSRPLDRGEYILGKLTVVWVYLAAITTVPALGLYVFAVLLSPELTVVWATWDLPLRILVGSAVLMIPTTAMALAFSSMTTESRYAGFAWFAVWIFGWAAYYTLTALTFQLGGGPGWTLVLLYHTLGDVQNWVFGLGNDITQVMPSLVLLAGITVVSLMILFRRVSAPMRI